MHRNIIDYAMDDNGAEFRKELYAAIYDKVADHIEAKKQEVAENLLGLNQEFDEDEEELDDDYSDELEDEESEEEIEEGYDSRGAYEKHDPKHPDFAKNYHKYKAKNPEHKLADFVAHMKKTG